MYEAYFWGNGNVLELDMYVVTQRCHVLNTTELFKSSVFCYVNFTSMKKKYHPIYVQSNWTDTLQKSNFQ